MKSESAMQLNADSYICYEQMEFSWQRHSSSSNTIRQITYDARLFAARVGAAAADAHFMVALSQ